MQAQHSFAAAPGLIRAPHCRAPGSFPTLIQPLV